MPQVRWIGLVVLSCCASLIGCQAEVGGSGGSRRQSIGAPVGTDSNGNPIDANGHIVPPTPGSGGTGGATATAPGAVVMRRLTRLEYDNTLRDVAGTTQSMVNGFPSEERDFGFNNNGAALTFPPTLGDAAFTAAQTAARGVVANLATHVACAPTKTPECADQFIRDFGEKAWRRPLTAEEAARLRGVFDVGNGQVGFDLGIEMVATSMLVSAPFWYRVELGDGKPVANVPNMVRPTSFEMATRLSYFLWNSAPDAALRALGTQDALKDPAAIKTQALAMLGDPKARQAVANFDAQWLQTDKTDGINKDPNIFPKWTTELRPLLNTEMTTMLSHAAWDVPNGLQDLLTTPNSFMNATLAKYYGVSGPTGAAFAPVQLDSATRSGILTRAGLLAFDGFVQTSPTLRGAYIRRRFLCGQPPPPDPQAAKMKPPPSPTVTTRQQSEAHASSAACKGCHQFIDPIGFGLEKYDAIGLYRETENGQAVDDTGNVKGMAADGSEIPSDIGAFKGAVELGQKMAASNTATDCFAQNWFRFTNGRAPDAADAATLKSLGELVRSNGGNHQELITALTQTDAFLYRPKAGS